MSKFVCTPCAPLSQIECRAISDEHLLGQGFDVVRRLISLARFPVIPPNLLIAGAVAVCLLNLWIYARLSGFDIHSDEHVDLMRLGRDLNSSLGSLDLSEPPASHYKI